MRLAVVYRTIYGTTRRYAAWIAEDLGADLLAHETVEPGQLSGYDGVIYGGGIYAGSIQGIGLMRKHSCPLLAVFTVGLADPELMDWSIVLAKNFPEPLRRGVEIFHFRGGIDYHRLGLFHRGILYAMKTVLALKREKSRNADERVVLATYGRTVDFTDRASTAPLVRFVKTATAQT